MTESTKNADFRRKPQIFADSPLRLEIPAFGGRRKPQKIADFRRKPQIFAQNRRKPQIGLRHLRSVTFSSALIVAETIANPSQKELGIFDLRPAESLKQMRRKNLRFLRVFTIVASSCGLCMLNCQHVHYENECQINPREIVCLAIRKKKTKQNANILEGECETKCNDFCRFSFETMSVRIV